MSHQKQPRIRVLSLADIDPEIVAAWSALEMRAIEANAYLSPHFVLPALRFLGADSAPQIVLVEHKHADREILIGVGVFESCSFSKSFPLPHIRAFRSIHSFLSGMLIDSRYVDAALNGFFNYFCAGHGGWHGVVLEACRVDGPLHQALMRVAAARHLSWIVFDKAQRVVLVPGDAGEPYLKRELPSRRKDAQRRMRLLEKAGQVRWRISDGTGDDPDASIEHFLELENMGWKGRSGSSLLACPGHGDFFREMARGFLRSHQAFFMELCLDGRVISSSFNLTSANVGFAFKIGWDPAYAQMSVGTLNEIELIRSAPDMSPLLDYIDSGSMSGEYLKNLWTARQQFESGAFATSRVARQLGPVLKYLHGGKRWLRRQRSKAVG